jgi:hypothetical protein
MERKDCVKGAYFKVCKHFLTGWALLKKIKASTENSRSDFQFSSLRCQIIRSGFVFQIILSFSVGTGDLLNNWYYNSLKCTPTPQYHRHMNCYLEQFRSLQVSQPSGSPRPVTRIGFPLLLFQFVYICRERAIFVVVLKFSCFKIYVYVMPYSSFKILASYCNRLVHSKPCS